MKDYATTTQTAKLLYCSVNKVIQWFSEGELKGFIIPGSTHRRISVSSIREFAKKNEMPLHQDLRN